LKVIPYGKQSISDDDIEEVVKVLRSDFLTQGPVVPEFELELCKYTTANFSIAVNSCTSALHIACLALGLKKGDYLWTSPITFVASVNCALYCGASIGLVDVEPNTGLMCTKDLKEKLIEAEKHGKLPKIIIPVHLAGQSCDMQEIHILSKKYGFSIIEDAAHAIGGTYNSSLIGCCKYSDITVFSFHPVKNITSGEGGAAMTNDENLFKKMTLLRSHGITRDIDQMKTQPDGDWYYEQKMLGFNYRMTDIHAALGLSQLKKIDKIIETRNNIAKYYDNNIKDHRITSLLQKQDRLSAYHLYVIQIEGGVKSRNKFFKFMQKKKINVGIHYIPIYRQPFFSNSVVLAGANLYYESCCSLPIFPSIKQQELDYVLEAIHESFVN
jgi:UDP-4-amino-4,6-dideoxy-N-acetyl-beta-L-altrosamine transaminase